MAGENLAEDFAPLFVAPPEVCAAAQRTCALRSRARDEQRPERSAGAIPDFLDTTAAPGEKSAKEQIREHLSGYLRAQGTTAALPRPEESIDASWPQAIDDAQARVSAGGSAGDDLNLVNFALLLRQLVFEFDAFGDSAQSQALFNRLNTIELVLAEDAWTGEVLQVIAAGDFLQAAAKIIVERDAGAPATVMPLRWPALDARSRKRCSPHRGVSGRARAARGRTRRALRQ
jgi:hypothetical protein